MIITSRENKIYKSLKALKDKKQRESEGLFLIEGLRGVRDAMENGMKPRLIALCKGCEISLGGGKAYVLAKKLFNEIADTTTPQGVIAAFEMPRFGYDDLRGGESSFVVFCENLRDPGNLGTIIRTADAAGAVGAVLGKGCCDLFNPKTVRSTVASIGNLPVVRGVDSADAAVRLKKLGYKLVAGALTPEAEGLYGADLGGRVAFVVGSEADGISPELLSLCDAAVTIPMLGRAESLNAAVAAAVMMYEKVRKNAN